MQKKCSNKVVTGMVVLQVCLLGLIFSQIPDFSIFNITNLSYILAFFIVIFAIGFFTFSFKSCVCHKEHENNQSSTSNSTCCSTNNQSKLSKPL